MKPTSIGQKVKLTGQFLKNTGQQTGSEGQNVWTILGFDSNMPDMAIVDEKLRLSIFSDEEIQADPSLKYRRIRSTNLYVVGSLDHRNIT